MSDLARDLASHAGVFAISVVNEIPTDIIRFYGRTRVERFVDELVDHAAYGIGDAAGNFRILLVTASIAVISSTA